MSLQNKFRLAISDQFFEAFSRLPRNAQNKVSEFINRFRQDPTRAGLNYESIRDSKDPRMKSLRVDQGHRAIVLKPDEGNVYILLWVDKHDDAYTWARRQLCKVNQVSGAVQIIDVEEVKNTEVQLAQSHPEKNGGRFDDIKDKHLMRLGVPDILLPAVRRVVTDADVDRLIPYLPREASDALLMLAAGYELAEIFQQLDKSQDPPPIDTNDLAKALENMDSLSRFMVITDDTELEEMLAAPLEKWRVFLHPSQRKLVEKDWNGPVRVLGGAGTGKTVVAMHRAKWLAQNIYKDPSDRILFTTFTKNLAVDIEANLRSICSRELMKRIKVIHLDAWVTEFLRQEGIETRILYSDQDRQEHWENAYTLASSSLGLPLEFYRDEWQEVVLAQGCQTLRDYLGARRVGRGTGLNRQQRQEIWVVFEEFRNILRSKGLREVEDAMRDAAQIVQNKGAASLPFRTVIVDEAQDLSDAAFSLLRTIVGEPHQNDLFIVGDAHQRIYGRSVVLSRCGIDVRGGRSRKLRLNYRTTDEIRQWATAILTNVAVDDLDAGQDNLLDYRSLIHGEKPSIQGFNNFDEELKYLLGLLEQLQGTEGELSNVCLALRTNHLADRYEKALNGQSIATKRIHRNMPDNRVDSGLRIATMHRVKGLQFDHMVLPGINQDVLPLLSSTNQSFDATSKEKSTNIDRSLLHVAATRAKKQVFVSYYGQPSVFLEIVCGQPQKS